MAHIDKTIGKFEFKLNTFANLWEANYTFDFIEQYWNAYDNFEKGKGNPTVKVLLRMAENWGVLLGDFFVEPDVQTTPSSAKRIKKGQKSKSRRKLR